MQTEKELPKKHDAFQKFSGCYSWHYFKSLQSIEECQQTGTSRGKSNSDRVDRRSEEISDRCRDAILPSRRYLKISEAVTRAVTVSCRLLYGSKEKPVNIWEEDLHRREDIWWSESWTLVSKLCTHFHGRLESILLSRTVAATSKLASELTVRSAPLRIHLSRFDLKLGNMDESKNVFAGLLTRWTKAYGSNKLKYMIMKALYGSILLSKGLISEPIGKGERWEQWKKVGPVKLAAVWEVYSKAVKSLSN